MLATSSFKRKIELLPTNGANTSQDEVESTWKYQQKESVIMNQEKL